MMNAFAGGFQEIQNQFAYWSTAVMMENDFLEMDLNVAPQLHIATDIVVCAITTTYSLPKV